MALDFVTSATSTPPPDPEVGKFRRDINALRAVAVVTVLLYHFHIPLVTGGFIGVDVFFVVSGYLMTRIIDGAISKQRFSIASFYRARVRRIVPALAVVCLAMVLFGLIFVDPMALTVLAKNAILSMLFVSNISYALEDSYFSGGAESNWFLHTWTLSVEWQFYLLYPLILLGLSRVDAIWRRKAWLASLTCILLCVASIYACAISDKTYQVGFFLLPTRAWELLAGGCVAFAATQRLSKHTAMALHLAGFLAILVSAFGFNPEMPWPSFWTILPVLGAVAVLAANVNNAGWLSLPGLQTLGTWSYSIYLWHWPIVVALRYWGIIDDPVAIAGGIALTLVLSALSYVLVETRLRDWIFQRQGRAPWLRAGLGFICILLLASACVAAQGFEQFRTRGMTEQTRLALTDYRHATGDWAYRNACGTALHAFPFGHICNFGRADDHAVAIIGDSHVEEVLSRYAPRLSHSGKGISFVFQDGCVSLIGVERTLAGSRCAKFAAAAYDYVQRNHFREVILSPAWLAYTEDADGNIKVADICFLRNGSCHIARTQAEFRSELAGAFAKLQAEATVMKAQGTDVVIVGPDLKLEHDSAATLYRRTFLTGHAIIAPPIERQAFAEHTRPLHDALEQVARKSGAKFLDPLDFMCNDNDCPLYDKGAFLLKDAHHVRASLIAKRHDWYLDPYILGTNYVRR